GGIGIASAMHVATRDTASARLVGTHSSHDTLPTGATRGLLRADAPGATQDVTFASVAGNERAGKRPCRPFRATPHNPITPMTVLSRRRLPPPSSASLELAGRFGLDRLQDIHREQLPAPFPRFLVCRKVDV